jgi:hypothetical protein
MELEGTVVPYRKRYYQKNKEKISQKSKEYYQRNKERKKELQKEYYQKNKEKYKKFSSLRYFSNKEGMRERNTEYKRGWRKNRSEKLKALE